MRLSLALAGSLLVGAATAQESMWLNGSLHQGQPRFGGTYHLTSRTWTRRSGQRLPERAEGSLVRVYDNSCLWTGAAANTVTFKGMEACERIWGDGCVPGTVAGPASACDDYLVSAVTFGHVTFAPSTPLSDGLVITIAHR